MTPVSVTTGDRKEAETAAVAAFPRGVSDPRCPNGHVLERTTSTDHRLLWWIETSLAVSATNDTLRELASDLRRYLNATCQHHWHHYEGDDDVPAHRQCLWCCDVVWLEGESTS